MHVTSPESKTAERGANVSHCTDFVSFHLYSLLSDPEFVPGFVNGPSDITKLDDREAGVRFVNREYDDKPDWASPSPAPS